MLTIHLRQHLSRVFQNFSRRSSRFMPLEIPCAWLGPDVECERDGGAIFFLDVLAEIEAMFWIKSALVDPSSVLIKNVSKAQRIENAGRGKPNKYLALCRTPNQTRNPKLLRHN